MILKRAVDETRAFFEPVKSLTRPLEDDASLLDAYMGEVAFGLGLV